MGNPKYKNGFRFTIHPDALNLPLGWRSPRKIFVNSMSDLFHENMPEKFLRKCFAVMEAADWHVYQVLTKRPERMLSFAQEYGHIPDHIWLGTSVEMGMFKPRIETLKKVDCRVKFISFEPLIGPIGDVDLTGISWAIAGGESGPFHRPVLKEWVIEIRDQCRKQGVSFFFKQWGGITPKSGGRTLDGREWNEYPSTSNSANELPLAVSA